MFLVAKLNQSLQKTMDKTDVWKGCKAVYKLQGAGKMPLGLVSNRDKSGSQTSQRSGSRSPNFF